MARTATTTTSTTTHHPHPHPHPHHHALAIHLEPPRPASSHASSISVVGDKIPAIPGFKTSAAFLSSLGANLRILDTDLLPSPLSTPPSLRASTDLSTALPPPSPLAFTSMPPDGDATAALDPATSPCLPEQQQLVNDINNDSGGAPNASDPLAEVPSLTTYVVDSDLDKIAALKLVADSIAQQRQAASRVLVSHPLNVAVFGIVLALVGKWLYRGPGDLVLLFTTFGGIFMAALATVRYITRGYIFRAEELKWDWLGNDSVLVTKFGDDVIGTVVLGWEKGEKGTRRKKSGKGIIRSWTVRLKYRHKSVGRALLEEAVKLVNERGGDGIEFAQDHANSLRVLKPNFYNASLDRREKKAQDMLNEVVAEHANWTKR